MHSFLYVQNKVDISYLRTFGENLKRIREEKKFTQAQLAIDCDFDVSVISRIERGAVNTSIYNIKIIADALNVPVNKFFILPNQE